MRAIRIWVGLTVVAIALGVLIIRGCLMAPSPSAGTPTAAPPAATQPGVMVKVKATRLSTKPGKALLDGLGEDARASRAVLDQAERADLHARLDAMVASGDAAVLTQPAMLIANGQRATVEVRAQQTMGGTVTASDVFTVSATPDVQGAGVVLDTAVRMSSAEGPVEVLLQDLGLGIGDRRTRRTLPALGQGESVLLWIPHGDGVVLIEVTAEVP